MPFDSHDFIKRKWTVAMRWFLLPIIAALVSFSIHAEVTCATLQAEVDTYAHHEGLTLVPGEFVPYTNSKWFSGSERLNDVFVAIDRFQDIAPVAKLLAQGVKHEQVRIHAILLSHFIRGTPRIALRKIAPKIVRKKTGKSAQCDGPNCWNATLNWHDSSEGIEATWRTTIEERLTSVNATYTKLAKGSRLQFGDVLVIRDRKKNDVVHTAIYLDHHLVWHKGSASSNDPWTFETILSAVNFWVQKRDPYIEFYRYKRK